MRARRGFTLLTALWVLGTAGVLTASALAAGRNAAGATRNRVEWTRARWRAMGCARKAQSVIDSILSVRSTESANAWRTLSDAVGSSERLTGCAVVLTAAGARLDVNSATAEMLERFFGAVGRGDARALSLDVVAMRERQRVPDVRALRRIADDVDWAVWDSLLSVEPGRIALSQAPVQVLQAIPGLTSEIANALVAHRVSVGPVSDLNEVFGLVSKTSGRELEERYQEASRVATADPDAWLLRSTARSGNPAISATVEWRITRQDSRVVVVRSVIR